MIQAALMAVGTVINGYGKIKANLDQAKEEQLNAGFYRYQADYAQRAGDRQKTIFDRQSQIQYGEQFSAFAKAGIDTQSSSIFMASEMLYRQQESNAIKEETDFNVRLATMRAEQSDRTAKALKDPMNNFLQVAGMGASAAGGMMGKG
jgi:hypothetical protein